MADTIREQQPECMETLTEALDRLERRGFRESFRARGDGSLETRGDGTRFEPESLVVEEVVRFEGTSDPEDETVLFALRTQDGRIRGTFVAKYGIGTDPACAEAIQRLPGARGDR